MDKNICTELVTFSVFLVIAKKGPWTHPDPNPICSTFLNKTLEKTQQRTREHKHATSKTWKRKTNVLGPQMLVLPSPSAAWSCRKANIMEMLRVERFYGVAAAAAPNHQKSAAGLSRTLTPNHAPLSWPRPGMEPRRPSHHNAQ